MKILVTGGAGFIGSAVIRFIINNTNHFVVNVDKLTYAGNLASLSSVENNKRYTFERVDICNAQDIKTVFDKHQPDMIMHLAAESHVDRSITKPADFINTNIVGTYVLLEQSLTYWSKLPQKKRALFKFHHISTDEVYGDLPHPDEYMGDLPLFTEQTPYKPSSPYSASKASADHIVRAWAKTFGLPTIVTNCSNNYGPFHFPEKLIPLTILNAISGKSIPVFGKGNQIRDWLYVDDHAEALILIITKGVTGSTYNIGGNNEKRNIEVVTKICRILDEIKPKAGSYCDQICFVNDRQGHDMRYAVDTRKLQKELGWQPKETFETGLRKTVMWYLDNQDWLETVLSK